MLFNSTTMMAGFFGLWHLCRIRSAAWCCGSCQLWVTVMLRAVQGSPLTEADSCTMVYTHSKCIFWNWQQVQPCCKDSQSAALVWCSLETVLMQLWRHSSAAWLCLCKDAALLWALPAGTAHQPGLRGGLIPHHHPSPGRPLPLGQLQSRRSPQKGAPCPLGLGKLVTAVG